MLEVKVIVETLPFIYIVVAGLLSAIYIRRKYMKPAPEICSECPLNTICSKLKLNKIAPPAKPYANIPRSVRLKILAITFTGFSLLSMLAVTSCGSQPTLYIVSGAAVAGAMLSTVNSRGVRRK